MRWRSRARRAQHPRFAALLTLALAAACGRSEPRAEAPDLLLLVTLDTLRADHLPFYGYPRPTAPFLTDLAARSLVFDRAISASSHTAPSHATMLTGLTPPQHGVRTNRHRLPEGIASLPELLRVTGRRSAAFLSVRFLRGVARGFDVVDVPRTPPPSPQAIAYRPAAETAEAALRWWRGRERGGGSWFLWIHLFDVHEWAAVEEIDPAIAAETDERRGELVRWLADRTGVAADRASGLLLANADRYDTRILQVDRALEELFGGLSGERSVFYAVVSDHGEGLLCHGYHGHGRFLYQEQLRVPLLLGELPPAGPGRRVGGLVRTSDLFPTLLEAAGVHPPELPPPAGDARLRARSLLRCFGGLEPRGALALSVRRPADEGRVRRGWSPGELVAVQDERFKVILSTGGDVEFYDLESDPLERRNLADDPPPRLRRPFEELLERARWALSARPLGESVETGEYLEELRQLGYVK